MGVLFKLYWAKFYAVGDAKQGRPRHRPRPSQDPPPGSLWRGMPYKSFYKVAAAAAASLNSIYDGLQEQGRRRAGRAEPGQDRTGQTDRHFDEAALYIGCGLSMGGPAPCSSCSSCKEQHNLNSM